MNIAKIAEIGAMTNATAPKTAVEDTARKDSTLASDNTDKFTHSETTFAPAYTKKNVAKNDVENRGKIVMSARQMKNESLKSYVEGNILNQGSGTANPFAPLAAKGTTIYDKVMSAYNAAEATSEGKDYWGADATAERIVTFAKTLAGEDSGLFNTLKEAFKKGFSQAEGVYGGKSKLPSVCYDTYSRVMDKFDDWEKEINGTQAKTEQTEAVDAE